MLSGNNKHLMTGPKGKQWILFPQGDAEGHIEGRGTAIKCLL